MKKIKFLDLAKQYTFIKEEIDNAISEIIKTSAFIGGNTVREMIPEGFCNLVFANNLLSFIEDLKNN